MYWTGYDGLDGVVAMTTKSGGEPRILASHQTQPHGIVVDDTGVYWAVEQYGTGSIMKLPFSGGDTAALVTGQNYPASIARTATHLYWGEANLPGALRRVAFEGGEPLTLADGLGGVYAIALDRERVYYSTIAGTVESVPIDGGEPTRLAENQSYASGIAVDATHVYWVGGGSGGFVKKVPLRGGDPIEIASNQPSPMQIAVDESGVYWTTRGTVMMAARGGGVVTLQAEQTDAFGIARCDEHLLDDRGPDGSVMRLAK